MRRFPVFLTILFFLCSSCQKNEPQDANEDQMVTVSFTAALPSDGTTRAAHDHDGMGTKVDQCLLQVWWGDNLYYERTVPVKNMTADFNNVALMKGLEYDFLFWADCSTQGAYQTADLRKVSLTGTYVGCIEARDAFCASLTFTPETGGFKRDVELTRPFAQLNIITNDIPSLYAQSAEVEHFMPILPNRVRLSLTAPTLFNVKTGQASSPGTLTYETSVYTNPLKTATGDLNTLAMDYLFAPETEAALTDISFTALNNTVSMAEIDHSFTNVPLRRNYRTNVTGSLLSVTGTVSVEVVPAWKPTN